MTYAQEPKNLLFKKIIIIYFECTFIDLQRNVLDYKILYKSCLRLEICFYFQEITELQCWSGIFLIIDQPSFWRFLKLRFCRHKAFLDFYPQVPRYVCTSYCVLHDGQADWERRQKIRLLNVALRYEVIHTESPSRLFL